MKEKAIRYANGLDAENKKKQSLTIPRILTRAIKRTKILLVEVRKTVCIWVFEEENQVQNILNLSYDYIWVTVSSQLDIQV